MSRRSSRSCLAGLLALVSLSGSAVGFSSAAVSSAAVSSGAASMLPVAGLDAHRIVADLVAIQHEEAVPAVGLAIVDAGVARYVGAWGSTGNASHPEARADTPFRLGSITKTFTALALTELARQRGLSLSTPLDEIVSAGSYANPFAPEQPIRLRHLIELTAGFADLSRTEFDNNDPKPLTLEEALALAPDSRRVLWPPGTRHSYTNVSPGLSALAVERLTGERFEDYVTRTLLARLGMTQASFFPLDRLPRGYKADGLTEIPYWHMTYRAFGALNASPRDMSRLLRALVSGGRLDGDTILSETTMAELWSPRSTLAADAGLELGYGLGIYGSAREGHVFYGHGGDADGFRSRYAVLPEHGRGYFVVINADNPRALERMRRRIERHLTRGLDRPPPPTITRLDAASLERWSGRYYPASVRFGVQAWRNGQLPVADVTARKGALELRHVSVRSTLVPVSEHLFRRPEDPVATVAFAIRGNCVHLQGELGNFVRIEQPRGDAHGKAFQLSCIWE